MKKSYSAVIVLYISGVLLFASGCSQDNDMVYPSPLIKPDVVFYGLTSNNQLVKYNALNSQSVISTVSITGTGPSEKIMAIDFRPATGQLYGLGNSSRLYIINQETGAATGLGTAPFTPAINGTLAGFDFNPTVDRIRLVTSSGQNLRLNPETGTVAAVDVALNPGTPSIIGAAYTNSVAGAATTTLFDIDISTNKLYKQDPPNNGTLVEVGSLLSTAVAGNDGGFDISPDNSVALANFTVGANSVLFSIDLTTGVATNLGNLITPITGLAIPTAPVAYAVDNSNNLQIFNFNNPGTPVSKSITGLQPAETILGIDMRPATGQLFALGSSSRIYAINMSSGAATMAATDAALNPGTPAISGAAYTNNFAGSTATVLFDIDATTDKVYTQNPPNNGTLVELGSLGVDAAGEIGFDIGGTTNKAYAMMTVAGATKIYSINTATGAATQVAAFPNAIRGFAVGLGF